MKDPSIVQNMLRIIGFVCVGDVKDLVEAVMKDLDYRVVKTVKGADLIGKRYVCLFDFLDVEDIF